MYLNEIINNSNIDIKKAKGSKLNQVAGFDELNGEYFLIDVDGTSAKALIHQDSDNTTSLVCVGKAGIWMSSIAYEFELILNQESNQTHSSINECSEEVLTEAVDNDFLLVSTPSGMLELRKLLDDGFISITSAVWTDLEHGTKLDSNNEQWVVSRFENHSVNSGFGAEDIGYVSIMENVQLPVAFSLSELLEEFNMNYSEHEEVVFDSWEDFKSYKNAVEFTM